MKTIPLTQGYEALVDDEDYEELSKYYWYVSFSKADTPRAERKQGHTNIYMSRMLMNAPDELDVDHKNGDTLDHRRENLRLCTNAQNHQNMLKTKKKTSSKYKGVCFASRDKKWRAAIGLQDIFGQSFTKSLGDFPSEEAAARAYDKVARYSFGEFSRLNFPEVGEQSCLR